jgi:hypothetical protein
VFAIIYGYVHREVAVQRWVYRLDHHQRPLYRSEDLAFSGVPIPDLLLVNTQIHDEYLEAPCFRVISADVTLPTYWDRVDDAVSEPTKEATRRLEGLLPSVGYLTIMDTEAMDNVVSYPYLWTGAIEFEKLFPRQPLRLRSVAILLRKMNRTLYLHTDGAAALQYINANTDKSVAPPTTYADLPCVLNSIGLQIEFFRCSPCGHLYGYAPSAGSVHIVPGGEHDVYHSISKFELCIYGKILLTSCLACKRNSGRADIRTRSSRSWMRRRRRIWRAGRFSTGIEGQDGTGRNDGKIWIGVDDIPLAMTSDAPEGHASDGIEGYDDKTCMDADGSTTAMEIQQAQAR